jgi:hypothetical protein
MSQPKKRANRRPNPETGCLVKKINREAQRPLQIQGFLGWRRTKLKIGGQDRRTRQKSVLQSSRRDNYLPRRGLTIFNSEFKIPKSEFEMSLLLPSSDFRLRKAAP